MTIGDAIAALPVPLSAAGDFTAVVTNQQGRKIRSETLSGPILAQMIGVIQWAEQTGRKRLHLNGAALVIDLGNFTYTITGNLPAPSREGLGAAIARLLK